MRRFTAGRKIKLNALNGANELNVFQIGVLCSKVKDSMAKKIETSSVDALVAVIVHGLQEKKGMKIVSIDLRKISSAFADFFIICHGGSSRQIDALADSAEDEVRKALHEKPIHREGNDESAWVLLDYINVVVHIFSEDKRNFYQLEELWGDGILQLH